MRRSYERVQELDRELVTTCRDIKILTRLNWHPSIVEVFLKKYARGVKEFPQVSYPVLPNRLEEKVTPLRRIVQEARDLGPLGTFLTETARSYLDAILMLQGIGTKTFTEASSRLYGRPSDHTSVFGTHVVIADHFIQATNAFQETGEVPEEEICVLPSVVQARLQERADAVFYAHPVSVVLDPGMASKAAAGARRVRLRSATCFSESDVDQLAEHELFVHSLTAINGREQKVLRSMGLGAPRTTRTQEGIAVLAEILTGSIDLSRLRRIALRVLAVHMALEGADFLEVFQFFLEHGQTAKESFQSSYRVFRGGDLRGGIAFTKDAVYLAGVLEVHSFLLEAIAQGNILYPSYLCAGRMALGDVALLEPEFQSGVISPPVYEPRWLQNRPRLLASLLYSQVMTTFKVNSCRPERADTGSMP